MNKIEEDLYTELSENFEELFEFKPSIYAEDWPSIKEPIPSITFRVDQAMDFENILDEAFLKLSKEKRIKYNLDWHHEYFYVSQDQKEFSLYDGFDYIINLSEDLSHGTFAHPWEQTMCIFGKELVDLTKGKLEIKRRKTLQTGVD